MEVTLTKGSENRLNILKANYEGFFKPNFTEAELAQISKDEHDVKKLTFKVDLFARDEQNNVNYNFCIHFKRDARYSTSFTRCLNGDWRNFTRARRAQVGDKIVFKWNNDANGTRVLGVKLYKRVVDNLSRNLVGFNIPSEVCPTVQWTEDEFMAAEALMKLKYDVHTKIRISDCNFKGKCDSSNKASYSCRKQWKEFIPSAVCPTTLWTEDEMIAAEALVELQDDGHTEMNVSNYNIKEKSECNNELNSQVNTENLIKVGTLLLLKALQNAEGKDDDKGFKELLRKVGYLLLKASQPGDLISGKNACDLNGMLLLMSILFGHLEERDN